MSELLLSKGQTGVNAAEWNFSKIKGIFNLHLGCQHYQTRRVWCLMFGVCDANGADVVEAYYCVRITSEVELRIKSFF